MRKYWIGSYIIGHEIRKYWIGSYIIGHEIRNTGLAVT